MPDPIHRSPVEQLLLTPGQAAESLSISARTLWSLTRDGSIPAVKVGRSVRYDPSDLRDWISRQKKRAG